MASFAQSIKGLGPQRLAALAGAAVILILFFGVMINQVSDADLKLLYSDLSSEDTNRIVAQLETMQVSYDLNEDGTSISVAPGDVGRARIRMAELGLPGGGNLGYELFDKDDSFGTSTFKQQIGRLRALEGELARTIVAIEQIRNARVHLVLPERQLFSRERQPASASVFVQVIGKTLQSEQVSAIRYLVASSVPELTPEMVSIIDQKGNLIARGEEGNEAEAALEDSENARVSFEKRLQNELEILVESIVGFGKVKARVSADMDFDRITQNEEIFDPDSAVARSTQLVEDSESSNEQEKSVTVENNLPEAAGGTAEDGTKLSRNSNRTEETINYEISKTVRSQVRQGGNINKLSVALLIDGNYEPIPLPDDAEKDAVPSNKYVARSDQELQKIETLVKSAMGYDQDRGDQLEVVNMQFARIADGEDISLSFWDKMDFNQYIKIAETLVLSMVGLLVLLLVVRPMMNKLLEPAPEAANAENSDLMLAASGLAPALEAPDGGTMPALANRKGGSEDEEMIDLDRVEGKIKASSVKKIGEIIDKHPEEAMQIIRGWIYETT